MMPHETNVQDHAVRRQQKGSTSNDTRSHTPTRSSTTTGPGSTLWQPLALRIHVHTDLFNAGRRSWSAAMISEAVVGVARFTPVAPSLGWLFFGLRPGHRRRGEWLKRGLLRFPL
jgi:hypothetical protein